MLLHLENIAPERDNERENTGEPEKRTRKENTKTRKHEKKFNEMNAIENKKVKLNKMSTLQNYKRKYVHVTTTGR
jgi:hypothetical protein